MAVPRRPVKEKCMGQGEEPLLLSSDSSVTPSHSDSLLLAHY